MYTNHYGSSFVAAKYCGLETPPRSPKGLWQHGWVREGIEKPEQLFGTNIESPDTPCFVALQWQEDFLKHHGYVNARAIGLPVIYLEKIKTTARPNTLLVMPQHSIPGMILSKECQYAYAAYIASIKNAFDECCVCIGAYDFEQGTWKEVFEAHGISCFSGANAGSPTSLWDQNQKLAQFSHMTSNVFGSHLVYAGALGLKLSINGPYEKLATENLKNITFYKNNPEIVPNVLARNSREKLEQSYQWLFCNPEEAIEVSDWAIKELGYEHKLPPIEMKRLFGWTPEIWIPSRVIPNSAWIEHAPFATWLIQTLKPKSIVELGTHYGYSYFSFCQTVRDSELETKCYSVDTWSGDEHAGFYTDDVYNEIQRHNEKYSEFSKLIRSTFDEASEQFSNGSIEILHIDGFHSYEAVRHDFETWLPKMAQNGIILFHDIHVHEREFGVWKFWEEIKKEYKHHLEFTYCHGLGCLFLSEPPSEVENVLRALGPDGYGQLQFIFQSAGEMLRLHIKGKQKEKNLTDEITSLKREIQNKENDICEIIMQINALRQSFSYRAMFPFRMCAIAWRYGLWKIPGAFMRYASISIGKFDEKDYIRKNAETMGDYWMKYPKLHYALYTRSMGKH